MDLGSGFVVHVARFKEPGTVEAGIEVRENLSEVFGDYLSRLGMLVIDHRPDDLCDFDEVFLAHVNKWPALGCNRVITE